MERFNFCSIRQLDHCLRSCVHCITNHLLDGGIAGLSVAQPLVPVDPVWMINILTVGLFILGFIFSGKEFALKTVVSAIAYPVLVTLLSAVVKHALQIHLLCLFIWRQCRCVGRVWPGIGVFEPVPVAGDGEIGLRLYISMPGCPLEILS